MGTHLVSRAGPDVELLTVPFPPVGTTLGKLLVRLLLSPPDGEGWL